MPYRRLPQTDLARIYALQKAAEMEGYRENGELVLSYQTSQAVQQFLNKFQRAHSKYQQYSNLSKNSSKNYRKEVQMARLYVSHFIQVMNMAIMRGELRKDIKIKYGLPVDSYNNPDLSTEEAVREWGKRIINAEEERTRNGGVPIYNPTIAKVKVHWGIFNDNFFQQHNLRENIEKSLAEVSELRPEADDIILDIWNQIESFYADLSIEARIEKCRNFGIIYYTRRKEREKAAAEQQQSTIEF